MESADRRCFNGDVSDLEEQLKATTDADVIAVRLIDSKRCLMSLLEVCNEIVIRSIINHVSCKDCLEFGRRINLRS